jgi:epoxyqueuosine reductase
MNLAYDIKHKAIELGFDAVGITDAAPIDDHQLKIFNDWLAFGFAARMDYMRKNLDKRTNPAKLLASLGGEADGLAGTNSVIVVALNYKPPPALSFAKKLRGQPSSEPIGRVAAYAQYQNYHTFIKTRLRYLADFIKSATSVEPRFKICVDSAPVAERALASRAGLGFIGKNHVLINPAIGPQILLGEIITDLKLVPDKPLTRNCAGCNKCVQACPTAALRPDGQFDANKCISYLTIEHKGQITPDLQNKIGDHLFGCDSCILACPYQQNAPLCKNTDFKFYPDRANLSLSRILDMSPQQFQTEFADSALLRTGLQQLKRNAQICLNNLTADSSQCGTCG